jgi:hypothetical protein
MTVQRKGSSFALISLALSLIGLGLLPFLLLNPPPVFVIPWQTQLIGGSFTLICILGIVAGVSPSHCSFSLKSKREDGSAEARLNATAPTVDSIRKKGHHPTCDYYQGHILRIQSRIVCAGCTGLVTGAIIALCGTALFFFVNLRFTFPISSFGLGWIFLAVGLLQHYIYRVLNLQRGVIRFLINVLFVVGAFLLLATLTQLTNSLVLASYLLILILYWIFTRISMSRRSHRQICVECGIATCPLSDA